MLNITANNNLYSKVQIADITGKIILTQTLVSDNTKLNFSAYGSGVYFVCLSGINGNKTIKIIK
jgi:hypothetical protein